MQIRIEVILVPSHETRIMRILAKDQATGNQQIRSQDFFHRVKNRRLSCQAVGPGKVEGRISHSFDRPLEQFFELRERRKISGARTRGENRYRIDNTVLLKSR